MSLLVEVITDDSIHAQARIDSITQISKHVSLLEQFAEAFLQKPGCNDLKIVCYCTDTRS